MAKFSLYNISLKDLFLDTHTYEYELGNKFFEDIDGEEIRKGNINVKVNVRRASSTFEFNFDIKGVAKVPCTRCLDDMNLDIDTTNRLVVKLGKEYSEESDEIVIIPEEEGEINIAWFLYEFIALAIPIKHVHPPGECNRVVSSKYRKHRAVRIDDDSEEDDGDLVDDDLDTNEEDDDDVRSDPRWDPLKNLNIEDN